jgi:biotin carboxyl carrier protein
MDVPAIRDLIAAFRRAGAQEFELSDGTFAMKGRFFAAHPGTPHTALHREPSRAPDAGEYASSLALGQLYEREELTLIRSSAVGRWRPSADLAAGASVRTDAVLGTLTVVGIPLDVRTPASGTVLTVYAESDDPVQYGQLLCAIKREGIAESAAETGGVSR